MKERPILMSVPMVLALLDGTKTQTRRTLKTQPPSEAVKIGDRVPPWHEIINTDECGPNLKMWTYKCPYGVVGDRLWVKERVDYTVVETQEGSNPADILTICGHVYAADGQEVGAAPDDFKVWKPKTVPSIFMPQWASRITLEITDVRIERLNEISEDDADAEGMHVGKIAEHLGVRWSSLHDQQAAFRALWESINGKGSWALNPWVWVLTFKRVKK